MRVPSPELARVPAVVGKAQHAISSASPRPRARRRATGETPPRGRIRAAGRLERGRGARPGGARRFTLARAAGGRQRAPPSPPRPVDPDEADAGGGGGGGGGGRRASEASDDDGPEAPESDDDAGEDDTRVDDVAFDEDDGDFAGAGAELGAASRQRRRGPEAPRSRSDRTPPLGGFFPAVLARRSPAPSRPSSARSARARVLGRRTARSRTRRRRCRATGGRSSSGSTAAAGEEREAHRDAPAPPGRGAAHGRPRRGSVLVSARGGAGVLPRRRPHRPRHRLGRGARGDRRARRSGRRAPSVDDALLDPDLLDGDARGVPAGGAVRALAGPPVRPPRVRVRRSKPRRARDRPETRGRESSGRRNAHRGAPTRALLSLQGWPDEDPASDPSGGGAATLFDVEDMIVTGAVGGGAAEYHGGTPTSARAAGSTGALRRRADALGVDRATGSPASSPRRFRRWTSRRVARRPVSLALPVAASSARRFRGGPVRARRAGARHPPRHLGRPRGDVRRRARAPARRWRTPWRRSSCHIPAARAAASRRRRRPPPGTRAARSTSGRRCARRRRTRDAVALFGVRRATGPPHAAIAWHLGDFIGVRRAGGVVRRGDARRRRRVLGGVLRSRRRRDARRRAAAAARGRAGGTRARRRAAGRGVRCTRARTGGPGATRPWGAEAGGDGEDGDGFALPKKKKERAKEKKTRRKYPKHARAGSSEREPREGRRCRTNVKWKMETARRGGVGVARLLGRPRRGVAAPRVDLPPQIVHERGEVVVAHFREVLHHLDVVADVHLPPARRRAPPPPSMRGDFVDAETSPPTFFAETSRLPLAAAAPRPPRRDQDRVHPRLVVRVARREFERDVQRDAVPRDDAARGGGVDVREAADDDASAFSAGAAAGAKVAKVGATSSTKSWAASASETTTRLRAGPVSVSMTRSPVRGSTVTRA